MRSTRRRVIRGNRGPRRQTDKVTMEVFGILLSIPAAFVASGLYILFLILVVRRFARASLWLWWSGVVILAFFVVELLLLATLGPVRSRAVVGPSFYPAHVALFLCGTPAL